MNGFKSALSPIFILLKHWIFRIYQLELTHSAPSQFLRSFPDFWNKHLGGTVTGKKSKNRHGMRKTISYKKESGNYENCGDRRILPLTTFFVIFERFVVGEKLKIKNKFYLPSKSGSGSIFIFDNDFDPDFDPDFDLEWPLSWEKTFGSIYQVLRFFLNYRR